MEIKMENHAEDSRGEEEKDVDKVLIAWECFGLVCEEFLHAMTLFQKNKNGRPMGHR